MVTDTTPRSTSNCNGSLKTFTFSFPIIQSSDLVVTLKNTVTNAVTTLAETTDYTVADSNGATGVLANYDNGGTITTTATDAYSASYQITLERLVPYTQAQNYTEGMPTLYETFEDGLDKATMQIQQVRDTVGRSPYCPSDDPVLDMEMPNATARAGKILAFDSTGKPVAGADVPGITLTTFGNNLVMAANAAAAKALLALENVTNVAQMPLSYLDTDGTLAANSDTKVASQKAVKTYADAVLNRLPAGAMVKWPTETAPSGWLARDGASYLRADYPALFAIIGTMYGTADGTHFNVPNDRGMFERGWANGSANDPDRASRTKPSATGATLTAGDHVGTEQADAFESHTHLEWQVAALNTQAVTPCGYYVTGVNGQATGATGGNETRPINRAYLPIIKY